MQIEEAQLLISRVLDGEADATEQSALDDAIRNQPEIADLFEMDRLEHQGLGQIIAAREATLLGHNALDGAFQQLAVRARSEAQTLRGLERRQSPDADNRTPLLSFLSRLVQPLPNLAGAAVALAAVLMVSNFQFLPGQVPDLAEATEFGPTRGSDDDQNALRDALDRMLEQTSGPNPDHAGVLDTARALELAHPQLTSFCTCESYRFHYMVAIAHSELGSETEAGRELVRAGLCMQQNPNCND